MYNDITALRDLAHRPAASFHEEGIAAYLAQAARVAGLPPQADRFGNIRAHYQGGGGGVPLVFVAHMDHPGFEVTAVEAGRVRGRLMGGVNIECFRQRVPVRVFTAGGTRAGAVVGAHLDEAAGVVDLDLEVDGAPAAGDFGVWEMEDWREEDGLLHQRAHDDLAGCAAALCVLRELTRRGGRGDVLALWTRAEEAGLLGAALAAREGYLPRNAVIVSLESSRALPGAMPGEGPVIRVGDLRTTFHHEAELLLHDARDRIQAADPAAKVQRQLMSGGTCEATVFSMAGYRATGLAFPLGNYHNVTPEFTLAPEYIHRADFLTAVDLLLAMVEASVDPHKPPFQERYDRLLAAHQGRLIESGPGYGRLV